MDGLHSAFTYDPDDPGIKTCPYIQAKLEQARAQLKDNKKKKYSKTKVQPTTQEILSERGIKPGDNLPRTMIRIFDNGASNLKTIAEEANSDYYSQLKKNIYQDTIDNINLDDIQCHCNNNRDRKKVLFEKILGKEYNDTDAMAWGNCNHTIIAAAKRQLKNAPQPDPRMAQDFIQFAYEMIEKYIGDDLTNFGYSYADWYNHLPYGKQKKMDRVREALDCSQPSDLTAEEIYQIFSMHYEGICKVEIQGPDGKPRMVCSIPDLVKFVMGPITWQLEEICAKHFPGYCGGKNLNEMEDEINEMIDEGFTKVVEGDGSAFDNTQDVTLKEVERYIYRRVAEKVYHVPRDIFMQISQTKYKIMDIKVPDGKKLKTIMTYHVLGTVFSGDCDTTLANTLRMALYNHYTNYIAGLQLNKDYKLFSKGDDFSVLYKSHVSDELIRHAYKTTFLDKYKATTDEPKDRRVQGLGQICKFLEIGGPESFKFCSLRSWYKDDTHICLTRDPSKLYTLAKYSRKIKTMKAEERYNYLLQQALALERSYAGIDIFDTMTTLYKEAADTINLTNGGKFKPNNLTTRMGDRRSTITTESEQYLEGHDVIFADIKHRDTIYYIKDNYWDTMQQIERIRTRLLTPTELQYVNAHIAQEFDPRELYALLAENK